MIGSRQLERVLTAAEKAGAKVVLVGDPEQLQAIEAGAAFRALSERHGAAEITEVRRQREVWQRQATRQLATGGTEKAVAAYEAAGMVEGHSSREEARAALVEGWAAERRANPRDTHVILAHTRVDVAELNQLARERMRQSGVLGGEATLQTERGERTFADGDRVMFLRNELYLGVKNGSLGTVMGLDDHGLTVRLDDGRQVDFDTKTYGHVDYGYASTIHKAQGVTVDRAHVLATPELDRHAAYVALSRHRDGVALHWGADDYADRRALDRTLGRERAKDTTLDYAAAFAERREIHVPAELQQSAAREASPAREAERTPKRSPFAGLKLGTPAKAADAERAATPASPAKERADALRQAVGNYARAWGDAERMTSQRLPTLPHQKVALQTTGKVLESRSPEIAADLREVLGRTPGLAFRGEGAVALALAKEVEARRTQELRTHRSPAELARAAARAEAHRKAQLEAITGSPQRAATPQVERRKPGPERGSDVGRVGGDEAGCSRDRGRSRGPER